MSETAVPFNYRYFVDLAQHAEGPVLDYGCGLGQIIAEGRARGLDIWGADTFEGYYAAWGDSLPAGVRDRVRRIENGRADFPDGHFGLVISNQVLEHVRAPESAVADMHRLLRPGGQVIAAFPVVETWYEGHVGLYFAHWLPRNSSLRRIYFRCARQLGCGLYHGEAAPAEWAELSANTLDEACFYYPRKRLGEAFAATFGEAAQDISADYMRKRLGARASKIPSAADPVLRFVYHKRAGEILRVAKQR